MPSPVKVPFFNWVNLSAVQLASPSESTRSHVPTSKLGSDIASAPRIAHIAIRMIVARIVFGTRALSSGANEGVRRERVR